MEYFFILIFPLVINTSKYYDNQTINYNAVQLRWNANTYTGGHMSWYSKFSGKYFCYFKHLSKRIQKQMIPHLKALI